jgi:hypothetical protein
MSTPFKQAYVVTMENGAIVLAVVAAASFAVGREIARVKAAESEQCAVWDICAFPANPGLQEGLSRLFRS